MQRDFFLFRSLVPEISAFKHTNKLFSGTILVKISMYYRIDVKFIGIQNFIKKI